MTKVMPVSEHNAVPWYRTAFGAHYPLLYGHRDEAEARRCLELLPRLAPLGHPGSAPILDLGCGDGRHLQWLLAAGLPAVGLDLSAHLLARAAARTQKSGTVLVRGDMRFLPWANQSFGAVLNLFTAFGYFGAPADNGAPVAEVARVLQAGGHWFLDYFDGQKVRAELGDGQARVRDRELECLRIRETRRYCVETRQVIKDVVLRPVPGRELAARRLGVGPGGLTYAEQVAVFDLEDLDALAAEQGLCRVAAAGGYDGSPLGAGTRWILVYRKEQSQSV